MIAKQVLEGAAGNLVSIFEEQVQRRGTKAAARVKRDGNWIDVSWEALAADARAISDGLAAAGVVPGDRVAILGSTTLDWVKADVGVLGSGAVECPIYQSNKPHEVGYILRDSGAKYIFCDTRAQAKKVLEVKDQSPSLQGIYCFEAGGDGAFEKTVAQLQDSGRAWRKSNEGAHAARVAAIKSQDRCCIIYTAGTTGDPKGVVLTHANWTYEANAIESLGVLREDEVLLFFLPLANVLAKVIAAAWFRLGFQMAFAESVDKLLDNAAEVKPTVLPAVPRIFEKAFAAVVNTGLQTPGFKGKLFKLAMENFELYAAAKAQGREFNSLGLMLGRRLVFPKLAEALKGRFGGRIRYFISGSAPLNPKIAYFFQEVGLTILEGYGLSETSAATTVNLPKKVKIGTVGPPVPGTEVKIAPDGEILIKGPGVFQGYFNKPEATAEVLKDGWFASGDIGEIDADGYVKITDRKKDIIVTAGGKKIPPQNLENELQTTPIIGHVVVHGDQRKFLSALVTLSPGAARAYAKEHGSAAQSLEELAKDATVRGAVQAAFDTLNAKLPSYSTVKKFEILPVEFTVEGGELTPKMSVKRKMLSLKYKDLLDSFYKD